MVEIQYAFIDESGNYGFDFENKAISSHLIIVGILVKNSNKDLLEQQVSRLSLQNIGQDHELRLQTLEQLKEFPFTIYSYVIDKRKISEDSGIRYKKTFFKRMNRLIFDDLSRTFPILDIVADESNKKEYLLEFKNYVLERSNPDLFNFVSFGFNNSHSDVLLGLASFIAETLATGYDIRQKSPYYPSFLEMLKEKIIRINHWPIDYRGFIYDQLMQKKNFKYDELILQQSIRLAFSYIQNNQKLDDHEEKDCVDFLNFLLYKLHENPNQYVYTEEILENLNAIRPTPIGAHYLRSNVVSYLRDNGVLVASSSKGYKLPICLDDIYDFVNIANSTIQPLLKRLAIARDQILLASNNEIDILNQAEFNNLKRIIELDRELHIL